MNQTKVKSASFYTLGCRVNQYETRAITEEFQNAGFEIKEFGEKSDICVINTCAVTAESERKSAQIIRRAAKSTDIVMVVGCFSEHRPEDTMSIPNVQYVGGAKDKRKIAQKALELLGEISIDITQYGIGYYTDSKVRSFLKIEDGCDGKCSYCIIPLLRGGVVARDFDEIVEEAIRISRTGCREIVLTGIEISAHKQLVQIITAVMGIDGIDRVRLGSLDPRTINDEFLSVAKHKKFMPHMHISLQSANNRILGLMKRPYTAEMAAQRIEKALKAIPGLLLSVDIISSFPTETVEELQQTIDFLKRYPISHIHAFPYSPRPGTVAAQIKEEITTTEKKRRHAYLLSEGEKICHSTLCNLIGTTTKVLIESKRDKKLIGCSEHYTEVEFESEIYLQNKIVTVKIENVINGHLTATLIKEEGKEDEA